jgi:hypothetical protein
MYQPKNNYDFKPSYHYYSFRTSNYGSVLIPASFNLAKVNPILRNSNKYVMSVQKLTVSTNTIPRLYSYIQSYYQGNTDPNQTIWNVALSYNGKFVNVPIEHVPQIDLPTPEPFTADNPYQNLSGDYQLYYKIDSIIHFVNSMLNVALQSAFTQLQGFVAPALAGTTAPQFVFNRDTGFVDLIADYNYYGPQVGTPVQVFMDSNLKGIMRNYNYFEQTLLADYYQFIFTNKSGDTTNTYCEQEVVQLDQFSLAFNELIVSSASIGIRPTLSDGSADVGQIDPVNAQNTTTSQSLITSFSVLEDANANLQRIKISYVPQGLPRYFSIDNTSAINNIDLNITYKDVYGNEFPLLLPQGGFVDCLIQFVRIEE